MSRPVFMLSVVFGVGLGLGILGTHILHAQQAVKTTDVFKTDIVGMEGKEIIVQHVEIAAGAASPKHYHPGHEAFYVLEGSGVVELDGKAPIPVKAGVAAYIPAKQVHQGKNGSSAEPIKLVVFRIHEKGQPVTVRVD